METTTASQSQLQVTVERIDDIPLLIANMKNMGIPRLIDEVFPRHGNWKGLSPGWVTTVWCAHIISEGDHCLEHVRFWAKERLEILEQCCGQPVTELDFTDDRLALILQQFYYHQRWCDFESALSNNVLQVYNIAKDTIRLDSTTTYAYCGVTSEGLFHFGHSKDYRPDLAQIKIMMSTTDQGGFPLVTTVVPGNEADDPLYIPAITQIQNTLQQQGLLYVGDSKMGSRETRAFIADGKNKYLCVLSRKQVSKEELAEQLQPVRAGTQPLSTIYATDEDGTLLVDDKDKPVPIAQGFELTVPLSTTLDGKIISWEERRFFVRSLARADSGTKRLKTKIKEGLEVILALNKSKQGKKSYKDQASLEVAVMKIEKKYGISGLLSLSYKEEISERKIRGYKGRPPRTEVKKKAYVNASINQEALDNALYLLGWQVYGTNATPEELSLDAGVKKYRANYPIEGGFRRIKGKPLSIQPLFLQLDIHVVGLVRLLSICLKVLVLLEFVVREALKKSGRPLCGVYGNPNRGTLRPSAVLILRTFKGINLTCVNIGGQIQYHITVLSPAQQRILKLLDFSTELYQHPVSCSDNTSDNHILEDT